MLGASKTKRSFHARNLLQRLRFGIEWLSGSGVGLPPSAGTRLPISHWVTSPAERSDGRSLPRRLRPFSQPQSDRREMSPHLCDIGERVSKQQRPCAVVLPAPRSTKMRFAPPRIAARGGQDKREATRCRHERSNGGHGTRDMVVKLGGQGPLALSPRPKVSPASPSPSCPYSLRPQHLRVASSCGEKQPRITDRCRIGINIWGEYFTESLQRGIILLGQGFVFPCFLRREASEDHERCLGRASLVYDRWRRDLRGSPALTLQHRVLQHAMMVRKSWGVTGFWAACSPTS